MIICANPQAQFQTHKDEILRAMQRVCESGHYILGPEVAKFEKAFAAYCNTEYAIGLNSGTDALILSLRALNIGAGDEVVTVSHTALATVSAVLATGAQPVLVDVDPEYYTLDLRALKKAITPKTKAIIAVHLYGQTADVDAILKLAAEHQLPVIEDCAQATGARYRGQRVGSMGDVGCFSFYPTKNLGAIGDGGMVVTKRKDLAERIRRLRQYGWNDARETQEPGLNSRLDEMQAAILNVKLNSLDTDNARRRAIAKQYTEALTGLSQILGTAALSLPIEREGSEHVYHLYVLTTPYREQLKHHLAEKKIMAGVHYPVPAHQHGGYDKKCTYRDAEMAVTNSLCKTVLSLPMYPELTDKEVNSVIVAVQDFYRNKL